MSVKVKGGMHCERCGPVTAVRNGHAVRNTLGAAATGGLALKTERWLCPTCGGKAYPPGIKGAGDEARALMIAALALVGAILIGTATSVVVGFFAFWLLFIAGAVAVALRS